MHFSVEIVKGKNRAEEPCVVEIYLDKEGIETLCYNLEELKSNMAEGEHVHLMADSWGGHELSDSKKRHENISVKHLKIISCEK